MKPAPSPQPEFWAAATLPANLSDRERGVRSASVERRAITPDEREALRRFWGRVVFAVGMGIGMLPLAAPPGAISTLGQHDAMLEVLALIAFCITVLPASVLAFWHRRAASVWLLLVGMATAALVIAQQHSLAATRGITPDYYSDYLFLGPLTLALFGIFTEWKGWPPLLERPGRKQTAR